MAVAFRIGGAIATNSVDVFVDVIAPTTGVVADDIFIAVLLGKNNQVVTAPDNWTLVAQGNNTANQRISIFWKRVVAGDAGATFRFTKPTDDNLLFGGTIGCFSGCATSGSPIDATTPSQSPNALSDTVTFADFNPAETTAWVVAAAVYNDDQTNPTAISGTNPTFAENIDQETTSGTDWSVFVYSGSSDGAATGSRTMATTSTNDAINFGVLFGLIAAGQSVTGAAVLASSATIAAVAAVLFGGAATVAASAQMAGAGILAAVGAAIIPGTATVVAVPALLVTSSAALVGSASMAASPVVGLGGAAVLAGVATLAAEGLVVGQVLGAALLVAAGGFAAAAVVAYVAGAVLSGSGSVVAAGNVSGAAPEAPPEPGLGPFTVERIRESAYYSVSRRLRDSWGKWK